ncbi:MAG: hypothetical protein LLG14_27375 [Nocardiaceae bacterium]|nr:hypothetical protein [Nocardiaceae bacterium]
MVPVKKPDGRTVRFVIEPIPRYQIKRITASEDARTEEDILQAATIDDARQTARALTIFERDNPNDAYAKVLDFGDVEIH